MDKLFTGPEVRSFLVRMGSTLMFEHFIGKIVCILGGNLYIIIHDKVEKIICRERGKSNPWPPRCRLGPLSTELGEARGELGHAIRFICDTCPAYC